MDSPRLQADFNGLFGTFLCLSHGETCRADTGAEVTLRDGMVLTAFDEDTDDRGKRDDLIATGNVEPSPDWLQCKGARWVLRIDENGVQHTSDVRNVGS